MLAKPCVEGRSMYLAATGPLMRWCSRQTAWENEAELIHHAMPYRTIWDIMVKFINGSSWLITHLCSWIASWPTGLLFSSTGVVSGMNKNRAYPPCKKNVPRNGCWWLLFKKIDFWVPMILESYSYSIQVQCSPFKFQHVMLCNTTFRIDLPNSYAKKSYGIFHEPWNSSTNVSPCRTVYSVPSNLIARFCSCPYPSLALASHLLLMGPPSPNPSSLGHWNLSNYEQNTYFPGHLRNINIAVNPSSGGTSKISGSTNGHEQPPAMVLLSCWLQHAIDTPATHPCPPPAHANHM